MNQFQVRKDNFTESHLFTQSENSHRVLQADEILVNIKKFAYTSNNITYAVAADLVGYWKFFPAVQDENTWGVIPVWGFAEVIESKSDRISVGEKLYGYFSPSDHLVLKVGHVSEHSFMDIMAHRTELPAVYNRYIRVSNEKDYDSTLDNQRMLLTPLHLTSYCLWDSLQDKDWRDAEQVIVLSASSKTSLGLAMAINEDENKPHLIGLTSNRNFETIKKLGLYDDLFTYENLSDLDPEKRTVLVDMSGNKTIISELFSIFGKNLMFCLNVGLTHWSKAEGSDENISARSEFFFAPSHIQKRISEWGPQKFDEITSAFMKRTGLNFSKWLTYKTIHGLEELVEIHKDVCLGKIDANVGLIVMV